MNNTGEAEIEESGTVEAEIALPAAEVVEAVEPEKITKSAEDMNKNSAPSEASIEEPAQLPVHSVKRFALLMNQTEALEEVVEAEAEPAVTEESNKVEEATEPKAVAESVVEKAIPSTVPAGDSTQPSVYSVERFKELMSR